MSEQELCQLISCCLEKGHRGGHANRTQLERYELSDLRARAER